MELELTTLWSRPVNSTNWASQVPLLFFLKCLAQLCFERLYQGQDFFFVFASYKSSVYYTFILKSVSVKNNFLTIWKAKAWFPFTFSVSASCQDSNHRYVATSSNRDLYYFVPISPWFQLPPCPILSNYLKLINNLNHMPFSSAVQPVLETEVIFLIVKLKSILRVGTEGW